MDSKRHLGDQQLEVLNYVVEHAPISPNEVARKFGVPRGLARTTICTVMSKLQEKGYLTREKIDGIWHYTPSAPRAALFHDLVERFVDKALGGSVTPFIAYLSRKEDLTPAEIEALRRRLDELEDTGAT